jgi:hypothetical protein
MERDRKNVAASAHAACASPACHAKPFAVTPESQRILGLAWNPAALPGLIIPAILVPLAFFVFWVRPGRSQNQLLGLLLFVLAISEFSGHGLRMLATDARTAYALYVPFLAANAMAAGCLLRFYGTLNVPWMSWLRSPAGKWFVNVAFVGMAATVVLRPDLYAANMTFDPNLNVWVANAAGPLFPAYTLVGIVTTLLGIPVCLAAARRAKTRLERQKAWALARAFVTFDAVLCGFYAWAFLILSHHTGGAYSLLDIVINFYTLAVANLLFALLLSYGILKAQLFDIDVKLRWTVKRGTLAGIFLGVFFVTTQLAQNFLSTEYGWAYGGAVAGLMLFAISPMQRVAERVAATAVPARTEATGLEGRKAEIYKAALEGALQDGVVTDRERTMLQRLQLELGIANAEARTLEADVRTAVGSA